MATISERLDELDKLGSPEAIARYLASESITGLMREPRACPISRYLQKVTTKFIIGVTYTDALWSKGDDPSSDVTATHLPTNVRMFVRWFDHGLHPELIEGWEQSRSAKAPAAVS